MLLARSEQALLEAMRLRDSSALDTLLDGDYSAGVNGVMERQSRSAALEEVLQELAIDSAAIQDLCAERTADTARVVVYRHWSYSYRGRRVPPRTDLLADVWTRREGSWRLLRRTALDRLGTPRARACAVLQSASARPYL
jgi:hypothetical protein